MSRFVRQLGKRFLKRFRTTQELVEKNEIGSDSPNILITADADRLAEKHQIIHSRNDGTDDADHEWSVIVFQTDGTTQLLNSDHNIPTGVQINEASMMLNTVITPPAAAFPEITLEVVATAIDLNTGTAGGIVLWELPLMLVDPQQEGFTSYRDLKNPVRFDISDLTELDLNADYAPVNPANFSLVNQSANGLAIFLNARNMAATLACTTVISVDYSILF